MNADPNPAKAIFLEAVERHAPDQWPAFLDRACAGRPDLRGRVEALLEAHREVGTAPHREPAEGAGPSPVATVDEQPIGEQPGTVIGPYKLIEPIGEGGMGTVWMAQQAAPVRRLVAVKLIKAGMDSRQVIARFETERQVLALMDHPHIARVLDAGATPQGRPYFAMELVKGIPITRYCDERRLSVRERLELFMPVCQAVQHAHQKGVIHRDLKPSNVLVAPYDGVPVVKVIDFGVAKAAGQPLTERTLVTGFGAVVGTLEYMSPEQAELNNVDIDTRSDIYSLGVLLYELLTGTTPLPKKRLSEAAFAEVLRIIREEEPPRPSTRLSTTEELPSIAANRGAEPSRLSGLVRGELDWIVMKALEKDRGRRYDTANGFATDVQRYLADEQVLACPPSAAYRFRKFARRNKRTIATTMFVAAALVAGTAVSTWQAIRAKNAEGLAQARLGEVTDERNRADSARQEADRRATEAREVVDFLINDLIGAASPSRAQGTIPTVDQVLARADENVAQKFAGRPLIEASIRHALGQAYVELGQYPKAEQHAARAVELRLAHLGPEHVDTVAAQNALDCVRHRKRKRAYWEEARKALEPIRDRSRRELGPEAELTIASTGWLANTLSMLGQIEKAVALADGLPENRQTLNVREELARFLYLYDHPDAALIQFQRVEALRPRLVPADDPLGLWIRTRLALVLREHGRFAEARPLLEQTVAEALGLRQKLPKRDQTIEEARGIAQVLLGRGPGLAPGVSPAARPPAPFTIEAPFRGVTPITDGRIAPGEYGPGIEATFDGDSNPGRLYTWYKSRSKAPEDLSVRIHTAYTHRSLFLAFRVRDQFVDASDLDTKDPTYNDAVEIYIDGDQVANDRPFLKPSRVGNREGFHLISDARGHQLTALTEFTNADWKVATARTPDGYIIEFEIPLALIDTRDGPEYVPATSGSELRVNFGIVDNDASVSNQTDYGIFWAEDPALSPFTGGEDFWTVGLRLVPRLSSSPRPASGR